MQKSYCFPFNSTKPLYFNLQMFLVIPLFRLDQRICFNFESFHAQLTKKVVGHTITHLPEKGDVNRPIKAASAISVLLFTVVILLLLFIRIIIGIIIIYRRNYYCFTVRCLTCYHYFTVILVLSLCCPPCFLTAPPFRRANSYPFMAPVFDFSPWNPCFMSGGIMLKILGHEKPHICAADSWSGKTTPPWLDYARQRDLYY